MSDNASVILKFNISTPDQFNKGIQEKCEGLMANYYRGRDPFGLVSRSATGLRFFVANTYLCHLWHNYREYGYETLRRMFDVDFICPYINVSSDLFMWHGDKIASGKMSIDEVNKDFFCYTADYGELFIDITGDAPNNLKIKYAFYEHGSLLDVRHYAENEKEWIGEDYPLLEEAFSIFEELAELMSEKDLENFQKTDFSHFYVDFVPRAEIETPKDPNKMNWPIEELHFGLRTYNCLKRARINTIGELAERTKADLLQIRNINDDCVTEICDKLSEIDVFLSE